MKQQIRQAAACVVESLEERRMLTATLEYGTSELENGTLIVQGTQKADTVRISRNTELGTLDVDINGNVTRHTEAKVKRIRAYLWGGSDQFLIDELNAAAFQAPIGRQVWVMAGNGNDTVNTGAANDTIIGGKGDDVIDANAGNDSVDGGSGNDYIFGSGGIDTLTGGSGADTIITGNKGDRVFADDEDLLRRRVLAAGLGVQKAVQNPASANFFVDLTWEGNYTRAIVNPVSLQPGIGAKIHFEGFGAARATAQSANVSLFRGRVANVGFMEVEGVNLARLISGKIVGRGQGVVRLLDGTFQGFVIKFVAYAFRSKKHDVIQGEYFAASKRGKILQQGLVPILRGRFESSPTSPVKPLPPPSGLGGGTGGTGTGG